MQDDSAPNAQMTAPPASGPATRRARSIKIRRIAKPAAEKKWRRSVQVMFRPAIRRKYASCTNAVACNVCPEFSRDRYADAMHLSSRYTRSGVSSGGIN